MKTILTMSLAGSLLLVLVMAVRLALGNRLHPRVLYMLWLPVALSLLLPVRAPSAVSVWNAPAARRIDREITQRIAVVRQVPSQPAGAPVAPAHQPSQAQGAATPAEKEAAAPRKTGWRINAWDAACMAWGVGAAGVAVYILAVNLRFAARVRRSRVPVDLPRALGRRLGRVRVCCSRAVPSPCLVGLIRPWIVVTPAALESRERLEHVLVHELSHWRQGDQAFALLRFAALIVHWFNPLVWIAAAMSKTDGENACDALAIRTLGEDKRMDYGKTLLSFLRARPAAASLMSATTAMTQGRKQIRRRITLIAKRRKYTGLLAALVVAAVLTGCAVTITGAKPEETPEALLPSASPTGSAQPTQAPEDAAEPDWYPEKVRARMEEYEASLDGKVGAFEDMTAEEALSALPELEADFLCFGRKNAAGDAYIVAYLRPRPMSQPIAETHTRTAEIYSDTRYLQIEEYGLDENGEFVTLRTYELSGEVALSQLEDHYFLIVLSHQDEIMIDALDQNLMARMRFGQTLGLTAKRPEQAPYLALECFLNDASIAATGYHEPVPYYMPLEGDLWQNMQLRLSAAQVQKIDKNQNWEKFWRGIVRTGIVLYLSEEESYVLCTDRLLVQEGQDMTGVIEDEELVKLLHDTIRDRTGMDPTGFSLRWFGKGLSQATLEFPDYMADGVVVRTQTLQDVDALADLCALFLEKSRPMNGGSACPFGARLEATRLDGKKMTLHFASDSCDTFFKDGIYYEYSGSQEDLFKLFPECAPRSAEEPAQ